jgi:hypothetical protein
MAGGPILPSSIYTGDAAGLAWESFYIPATNTNTGGAIASVFVAASIGSDVPVKLQFNLPEVIPTGTMKLRCLAMANATSGTAKMTASDGQTAVGSNIGATTLTGDTQVSQTWTTADILVENKVTLATTPTANSILTVLCTFNHTSWTLAAVSAWQFTLIWE